ncbi:flagellar brake protein [Natronospira bacteriovora]|uniref:Flagellar brake protein n=1 Tax=Natronospira bacteriovora TaxID=3069753 RepID=A0ABU0W3B0_9GAMM|nr:PilZ domain-containing protein [Natronospira sp. AB-CW4]MDQ2068499.1 flagellar brake protein [Natronospira sp. AB-CW4]
MARDDKENPEYEPLSERQTARIRQLLIRLRDQRSLLNARFQGRREKYGTLLIDADLEKGELLFDELTPTDGDRLVRLHGRFQVVGHLDGAEITFPVKVIRREVHDGLGCYRTTLPDTIRYHQRRRAFRVEVPARPPSRIVLATPEGAWFEGRLADISITGAGFQINTDKADELPEGTHCECHLDLPSGTVETPAEIRFNKPITDSNRSRLGLQFTRIQPADRRRIEKFVVQLQRRMLKQQR